MLRLPEDLSPSRATGLFLGGALLAAFAVSFVPVAPSAPPPPPEWSATSPPVPPPDPVPAPPVPSASPPHPLDEDAGVAAMLPTEAPRVPTPGLLEHLAGAEDQWLHLASDLEAAPDPRVRPLAPEARALAQRVPSGGTPSPSVGAVARFLVEERFLVDRVRCLGGDAGSIGREVDAVGDRHVGVLPGGVRLRAERLARAVEDAVGAGGPP